MHHRHTILRQRDSLSEEVSSRNSIRSENRNFLGSRHSSTASITLEAATNTKQSATHKQNTNYPMNNERLHHNLPEKQTKSDAIHKDSNNSQTINTHNNTQSPLSQHTIITPPIASSNNTQQNTHIAPTTKVPTKQNKPNTCSDDEDICAESPSNDLNPPSDEKDDELSDLPPSNAKHRLPFMSNKMRVDSSSRLTTSSPSISNRAAPYQIVDASHAMKPSEVKREANKSEGDNLSKAQKVSNLLYEAEKTLRSEKLPEIKTLKIAENNTQKKKKKRHKRKKSQEPNKCKVFCTRTKEQYTECNKHSAFCIKCRRLQFLGRKYITTSAVFKWFILICILLNCFFIAMEDPIGDPHSDRNKLVDKSETVFAIIFTAEMVIKMFCNGLFGNHMLQKGETEEEIESERLQNEEKEKQMTDRETSENPINQTTESVDHETEHKIDPKQAIEMADFGHDVMQMRPITHRDSVSFVARDAAPSTSTYISTHQSSSLSTEKQQNDRDPKYYVGYFRDNWNILDFIIVVTSWIEFLPIDAGSNLTAIRVLRVLRPLRTFTKIKSLKVLIATIIKSLRGLSDVLVLLLFLFVVFAIIGIQMFSGKLHQQCFSDDFRDRPRSDWCCDDPTKWAEDENFCILRNSESGNNNTQTNGCPPELAWCLNIAPNPNGGVTNFDNIIFAMLNVFVTISLEGWAAIQYKLQDTGATLAWLYFVSLTFIVGFFAANLCLAVIESVYGDEMEKKHKKEQKDGDDKVLRQATEETNIAWRKTKKAKMLIVTSPDQMHSEPSPKAVPNMDLLYTQNQSAAITPNSKIDLSRNSDIDEDASFYKIDSFRLPYVGPDGQENEFRTRIVMELQQHNPKTQQLQNMHERCKSVDTRQNKRPSSDNVLFSVPQAGLIQTSQEWTNLQLEAINKEMDEDNTNTKRKINHHKRASSFKLKKNKKVKFAHELGLGTQSYMHRYRTGHLPNSKSMQRSTITITEPVMQLQPALKTAGTTSYFTDEDDVLDLDTQTDQNSLADHEIIRPSIVSPSLTHNNTVPNVNFFKKANKSLTTDERRARFARSRNSRDSRSNRSISRGMRRISRNATQLDVLKVDYKTTSKENFESAMSRVKLYVNAAKKEELEDDVKEYTMIKSADNIFDQSHADLVDDLTFGDMPLEQEYTQHAGKNNEMSGELRRKQHKAKKKRKENEILARRAIIIADTDPDWTVWVEARDAKWIDAINALVVSKIFQSFIMIIIIANTVVLALTWPNQDQRLKDILETANTVFTFLFILEAVLKIIGLGPKAYFADNWNIFDFIIVFVSICEMLIDVIWHIGGGSAISALRSMRLLRAFRLLGKFDKLKQLFMLVVASMHEVSVLTLVLAIFIFMFAALAMSLFGGKLILLGDRRSGRWRFDNFYWSWVNVFMVISGDSWNEVMYDTVKATGDKSTTIYYVIVVCFGTFVILNLFVAILLSKMGSTESDQDFMLDGLIKYSKKMWVHNVEKQDQVDRLVMSIERKKYIAQFKDKRSKWKHHRDKELMEGKSLGIFTANNRFRIICHRIVEWSWFEISIDILILINCVFLAMESPKAREHSAQMFFVADILFTVIFVLEFLIKVVALGAFQQPFRKGRSWRSIKDDDKLLEWTDKSYQAVYFLHRIDEKSILDLPGLAIECKESNDGWCIVHLWGQQVLRIVYHNGSLRTCYKLVNQDEGKWEIWHSDVSPQTDSELQTVLTSFDLTDHHHNAYFASNWNRLDAVVVLVAVLGVGFENVSFLRALRAFRPFRIMVRFKKIKVVLGALLRAIPGLFNTFLFCILFWFVLSILGVNWYSGKFRHCRIDSYDDYDTICADLNATIVTDPACDLCSDACVMYNIDKVQCDNIPSLIWTLSVFNFDNVFEALHALFVVSTLSGWNFVMYEAIDSTLLNAALKEDNHPEAAVYFMIVVVLCSFFSLNLIVSVVVDNFNTIKAEKDGSAFQTEEQALWVNNKKLLEQISLQPTFSIPKNCFLRYAFYIVEHPLFDPFIMTCIILNAVSMALEHYNQTEAWSTALHIADVVFVTIFCLEAILKIAAYGFRLYIMSNWNKFDFVISIIGLVQLLTDSGLGLNVLRLFRVARLLRLLHKAKTLKLLFWTLVYSIPSLWNIGLLLFVIFFIYAVVGMHVLTDYVTEIHEEENATTFWNAFALLYRVGTEDGWTDVYQAYLEAWPVNERYKIYLYFVSFFVLGTLVLINLFIAVVLDSFEENHESFSREDQFTTIQIWRDIWSFFDPQAKREIPVRDFIDILRLTPSSQEFKDKHKIRGPGFFDGNPFFVFWNKEENTMVQRNSTSFSRSTLLQSISSLTKENKMTGDKEEDAKVYNAKTAYCIHKIKTIYNVDTRREKLREICANVAHADMIRLLLRLRLRVELHEDDTQELTCFGKLITLVYEICNSMGVGSRAGKDELIKQHTLKTDKTEKDADTLSEKEKEELRMELQDVIKFNDNRTIHDPGFDRGHKTWYVSYDDALLAICSEVIGPRLPDGFPMFEIAKVEDDEAQTALRIVEWYTVKYDCYDVFKKVTFEIEQKKQYADVVPSQHVSHQRQKELQIKTRTSVMFKNEFKKIKNQIAANKHNKQTNINVFIGNNENIVEEEKDTNNNDDDEKNEAVTPAYDDDENDT